MKHPLMDNNNGPENIKALIEFLKSTDRFTNGAKVREFEKQWSEWLGVKYSVFVNSGSSANVMTMEALKHLQTDQRDEIIVPPLTWISDIAAVIRAGYQPVFVDIDPATLAMDADKVKKAITPKTRAVFLTHILGFNGLNAELINLCKANKVELIEDCCESHGALFEGKKTGTFGLMSNFSFYFAHHLSTIEGGMISTNDEDCWNTLRLLRSHGMLRESDDENFKEEIARKHPELNEEFIFPIMGHNFRSTEINAVLGLEQLKGLDANIAQRNENAHYFYSKLSDMYWKFELKGMSNYAFVVALKDKNPELFKELCAKLWENEIEFRRGTSGGGNQLRQPYLKNKIQWDPKDFSVVEHVHEYGMYIGNYPSLSQERIDKLLAILNSL